MRRVGQDGSGEPSAKRTCTKLIRYSPEELRLVVERAHARGRPVASYVREASLDIASHARRTHANDALIYRLGLIATRLSSLATVATERELAGASEFASAVDETLDLIRQFD